MPNFEHLRGHGHLGTWCWDPATDTVSWSPTLHVLFGVDPDHPPIPWSSQYRNYMVESFERLDHALKRCVETGEPELLHLEGLHTTGRIIYLETHIACQTGPDGALAGVTGVVIDRTETVRTTQALRLSNEQFASAFRYGSIGMALVGIDGYWLRVNPALSRMLGYSEDDLLRMTFQQITHPDDLAEDLANVRRLLAGDCDTFTIEKRYFHKTGATVWVSLSVSLAHDDKGKPLYFISQVKDITEIRRDKDELMRRNALLEANLNASINGILVVDREGRKLIHNAAFLDLWHIPAEIAADPDDRRQLLWMAGLVPHKEEFLSRIEALYGDPTVRDRDEITLSDGTILERYTAPVVGEDGTCFGRIWVYRNITEERRKMQEIETATERALSADRTKSEFLAVMSHELRTPLHGIEGYADLILNTAGLPAEVYEHARVIHSCGEGLLRILQDILDFSQLEADRIAVQCEPFSLSELAWGVVALLEPRATAKGLRMEVHIGNGVPATIRGDAGRIRQVLLNLIGNAVKFTERGSVKLRVSGDWVGETPETTIRFEVEDTGPGISADLHERIFQPFTQADASVSRRHGGTGLGLSIAKRLVERMGGTLEVRSTPGRGATFGFALRRPVATSREDLGAAVTGDETTEDIQPLRILVAEDDSINVKLVVRMLHKLGHTDIVTAANGRLAVEAWESSAPDVILMDLQMPGSDGFAATRAIREHEAARGANRVFIAALTANVSPDDRRRCFQVGMDHYLSKPVNTRSLAAALKLATTHRNSAAPRTVA